MGLTIRLENFGRPIHKSSYLKGHLRYEKDINRDKFAHQFFSGVRSGATA
jgi:hypothetical protein